jgi:hypothetical protein
LARILGRIFRRRGRERLAVLCCDAGADAATAERAAAWVVGFHPGVGVALDGCIASLTSEEHSDGALRRIWLSALLNEIFLARGAGRRAAVIEALMR